MTINNFKTLFNSIADNHFQIKSFGWGKIQDVEGVDSAKYVRMWVVPGPSTVLDNTIERTFTILIFDLVQKDQSNETEVLSDTEQILDDVIRIVKYDNDNYTITNQPTLNPFTERFGDDTTGYSAEITIETDHLESTCDIPMDEYIDMVTSACNGIAESRLTCSSLALCPVIISIDNELADHESRIEALEQGGGGLDCDDVAACQVIIDIQTDITDINTAISNLPLNPTLAQVLTNNNVTDDIHIQSTNNQSLLALEDATLLLERRTNNYLCQIAFAGASNFKYESLIAAKYGDIYIGDNFNRVMHSDVVLLDAPIIKVTQNIFDIYEVTNNYYLRLKAEGGVGYPELSTNKDGIVISSNKGEYLLTRTVNSGNNNILIYSNGKQLDLSATAGGTPNITISHLTGYIGVNTTTPSSELHVLGTTTISTLAGTANRMVVTSSTGVLSSSIITKEIGLTVDGQGGVITTGSKGFSLPQFNGTILSWQIKGDDATTGSIVIDIKRNGTSIVGAGNKPTISAANDNSANISGWTSSTITAGDKIEYNVDSASTFTRINLVIKIQQTI